MVEVTETVDWKTNETFRIRPCQLECGTWYTVAEAKPVIII